MDTCLTYVEFGAFMPPIWTAATAMMWKPYGAQEYSKSSMKLASPSTFDLSLAG